MHLGRHAVWTSLNDLTAEEAARFAQKIEAWGYSALWIPEGPIREPFAFASFLLANTTRLILATGVANIYSRDATAARAGQMTLNELYGGRFLFGLGVSHRPMVEARGHGYAKPLSAMQAYLEAMNGAPYHSPKPSEPPPRVIGALGPKMMELARTHADGAHPYLTTPEHTARARRILGPDKLLCVEQKVVLETNPAKARKVGHEAMKYNLALSNYRNNLESLGFTEADMDRPTDKLVDALIAWGDEKAITARVNAHLDAGATQVCIQPVNPTGSRGPDLRVLELLAPMR